MTDPQTPLPPLTADDYKQLTQLVTSQDAGERTLGASLSKTLTPQEQQAFFDYQKQAHGAGPSDLHRADNQVGGMPPEMVPIMALRAVPGAVRAISGGVGLAGKAMAGAGVAGPVIASDLARRGLSAAGVPSWAASGIGDGIGIMLGGKMGGARAAAEEAPLSAEGQVLAKAGRSSSGVPEPSVGPSPRGGAVEVPEPTRPPSASGSGLPMPSVGPSPQGGTVSATERPVFFSGSGLPRPGADLESLSGQKIRPMGGFFSNPDEAIPSSVPPNTGGPLTEAVRPPVARGAVKVTPQPTGGITLNDLTPEERAAFNRLVFVEHHEGGSVLKQIASQRLASALGSKIGGS